MNLVSRFLLKIMKISSLFISILILIGAIQSNILDWSNFSGKAILLIAGIVLVLVLIAYLKPKIYKSFFLWVNRHLPEIFWVMFFLVIVFQVVNVNIINSAQMNDAAAIQFGVTKPETASWFLSRYPNNQFLFFVEYLASNVFGFSGRFFQYISLISVDISIVLTVVLTRQIFQKNIISYFSGFAALIFLGIQPIFLVVYTDTLSLPFMLAANVMVFKSVNSAGWIKKLLFAFFAGIAFFVAYSYRPSTAIFAIALMLVFFLDIRRFKNNVLIFFAFLLGFASVYAPVHRFETTQDIVFINKKEAFPVASWLLIGSAGDENDPLGRHGAFYAPDVDTTLKAIHEKNPTKILIHAWWERLQQKGLSGTVKLYYLKFRDTTDTGVLGYHRDGLWLSSNYSKIKFNLFVQNVFNEDGKYRKYFNYVIQLMYLPVLVALIASSFTRAKSNLTTIFITATFLGGLLFLITFESGGTKYLIQYIPYWSVLVGSGFEVIRSKIMRRIENA